MLILSPEQNTFTDPAQSLKSVKVVTGINPCPFLSGWGVVLIMVFVCFFMFCHWIARKSLTTATRWRFEFLFQRHVVPY